MDEEKLLMEEQAELATSLQYEAALAALQAQNDTALKEMLQLEQELLAATSENDTLSRFKSFSQEQGFSIKAESYKIAGEKHKTNEMLLDLDKHELYWKTIGKKNEKNSMSFDAYLKGLYNRPWILQKKELQSDVHKLHELFAVKQEEFAKMENANSFKSPKGNNSMDTNTLEMFRNMVRSELRLNPARAAALQRQQQELNDSLASSHTATPPRPERSNARQSPRGRLETTSSPTARRLESTPTRKQKEPSSRRVSSPPLQQSPRVQQEQQYQYHDRDLEVEPLEEDDNSNLAGDRMEFDDDSENHHDLQQSQETEQEYEGVEEEEPEGEPSNNNLYNDLSSDALQVGITYQDSPRLLRPRTLSPTQATPPDARPKPPQNYAPKDDAHLFKVPQTPPSRRRNISPPKNVASNVTAEDDDMNFLNMDNSFDNNGMDLNNSQDGGNDLYNLLGDNNPGSTSDNPMFSFLQEHTNNSEGGANNFFFGTSSPRAQKDESSHGFLF